MQTIYHALIPTLWLLWLAVWVISAVRTKPVARAETIGSRLSHLIPLGLGATLLTFHLFGGSWLAMRVYPQTVWSFWSGAALVALGLGFAVWARVHLAGNWSSTVTLKQDHSLTRTTAPTASSVTRSTPASCSPSSAAPSPRPSGAASLRARAGRVGVPAQDRHRGTPSSPPSSATPTRGIVPRFPRAGAVAARIIARTSPAARGWPADPRSNTGRRMIDSSAVPPSCRRRPVSTTFSCCDEESRGYPAFARMTGEYHQWGQSFYTGAGLSPRTS